MSYPCSSFDLLSCTAPVRPRQLILVGLAFLVCGGVRGSTTNPQHDSAPTGLNIGYIALCVHVEDVLAPTSNGSGRKEKMETLHKARWYIIKRLYQFFCWGWPQLKSFSDYCFLLLRHFEKRKIYLQCSTGQIWSVRVVDVWWVVIIWKLLSNVLKGTCPTLYRHLEEKIILYDLFNTDTTRTSNNCAAW